MRTVCFFLVPTLVLGMLSCNKADIDPTPFCTAPDFSGHPRQLELQGILEDHVRENQLPGALIAMRTAPGPLWVGAWGKANLEENNAMVACTPFRTGSITKVFVATLALMFQEEGRLDLDDPLTTHLPAVRDKVPDADRITLRMLLDHSSGLRHPSDDDVRYQLRIVNDPEGMARLGTQRKLEEYVFGHPLLFAPGQGIHYSNAGYWLMQQVLERVSGRSLSQLLQDRITAPLGLVDTWLAWGEDARVARGYGRQGAALVDVTAYDRADSDGDPAGGLVSTATDLVLFGEALFSGQLISPASLAEMKQVSTHPGGSPSDFVYGLGIETWSTPGGLNGYGKNGSLAGADANWIIFPEQATSVVIFTNYGAGSRKDFIDVLVP